MNTNKKMNLLLVEDEEHIASGLILNFELEGFKVFWANDGAKAIDFYHQEKIHIVILDLMLPKLDGHEVLKRLRHLNTDVPIIVISAKDQESDKIYELKAQCDDYLTKPFSLVELLTKVKRQSKKYYKYLNSIEKKHIVEKDELFEIGEKKVDLVTGNVFFENFSFEFTLTDVELSLLKVFILNQNVILGRSKLLELVWSMQGNTQTRTVDIFVGRLRKYFEEDVKRPKFFLSIRGKGYIFRP